jgi:hypothetical protein
MTPDEQRLHANECNTIRSIVSALRLLHSEDEDQRVALARLENWLDENDGRWVTK